MDTFGDRLEQRAYELGTEHGENAASWYFDGNTPDEDYARVLRGIEEGDPAIYDTFPTNPLSGEWAGAYDANDLMSDLGFDVTELEPEMMDDLCRKYEDGYDVAVSETIEAAARLHVEKTEPARVDRPKYAWPGGYPLVFVMNDGEVLCADCVNDPDNPIHEGGEADGWRLEGCQAHMEGSPEVCAHCGVQIESAYGDPDAEDDAPKTYDVFNRNGVRIKRTGGSSPRHALADVLGGGGTPEAIKHVRQTIIRDAIEYAELGTATYAGCVAVPVPTVIAANPFHEPKTEG